LAIQISGSIPEARTKHEAEQAEIKLKRDVFAGKYGKQFGTMSFTICGQPYAKDNQFGEGTFLECPRITSVMETRSFRSRTLLQRSGQDVGEISPAAIERFKNHPPAVSTSENVTAARHR